MRPFIDYPPELRAAVNAYDEACRDANAMAHRSPKARPMSEANKAWIAPSIMAAIRAYIEATGR